MSGTERIVDINLGKRSKLFGKFRIVLFFSRIKSHVLDQNGVAAFQRGNFRFCVVSDDIGSKCHFAAEVFVKSLGNRLQREFFSVSKRLFQQVRLGLGLLFRRKLFDFLFLLFVESEALGQHVMRLAHMGAKDDLAAFTEQIFDRGKRFDNPLVARDNTVFEGDVEIASDKNFFAGNIDILDGFLVVVHIFTS